MKNLFFHAHRSIDRWLLHSESNAAGRVGLFRILYAVFFLWHLSDYTPANLHELPNEMNTPIRLNDWLPADPPVWFYEGVGGILAAGLVLLMFGYRTSIATAIVAVFGVFMESLMSSADSELSSVFVSAYIPIVFLICGDWGATWSVDAVLRRRAGAAAVELADASPRFVLPIHALQVILVALYVGSGIFKVLGWERWIGQEHFLGNLMLYHRIEAYVREIMVNPIALLVYHYPIIDLTGRVVVMVFELTFFMTLFNHRLRALYVSAALIFHAINGAWVLVTFTSVLIVYGLFVDWHALAVRFRLNTLPDIQLPSGILRVFVLTTAVVFGALWNRTPAVHTLFTFGGTIDPRVIWIPLGPIAVAWFALTLWRLSLDLQTWKRARTAAIS